MIEITSDHPIFKNVKWVLASAQPKKDKTRPTLSYLNVERGEEETSFVCTDGQKLHKCTWKNTEIDSVLSPLDSWVDGLYRIVAKTPTEVVLDRNYDNTIEQVDYKRIYPQVTEETHKIQQIFVGTKEQNVSSTFCEVIISLKGGLNFKYFKETLKEDFWTANIPKNPLHAISFHNETKYAIIMPCRLSEDV